MITAYSASVDNFFKLAKEYSSNRCRLASDLEHLCYGTNQLARVKELFNKLFQKRMLIRLVGVRFSHLVHGNYQFELFDAQQEKLQLYQAMDRLKKRYGSDIVRRAVGMGA